jgi:hypothetical protein
MDRVHQVVESSFSSETSKLVRQWIDEGDREAAARALSTAR